MKVRGKSNDEDKIELQMTPMIDIVFQLLVFFIMTFKIVAQEGDFNIKMPAQGTGDPPVGEVVIPMNVVMQALPDGVAASRNLKKGELGFLRFNDSPLKVQYVNGAVDVEKTFGPVRRRIINVLGDGAEGPGGKREDQEVTLKCDDKLRYENVIHAMTYVSGYIDEEDGTTIIKLVEKVNLSGPGR